MILMFLMFFMFFLIVMILMFLMFLMFLMLQKFVLKRTVLLNYTVAMVKWFFYSPYIWAEMLRSYKWVWVLVWMGSLCGVIV